MKHYHNLEFLRHNWEINVLSRHIHICMFNANLENACYILIPLLSNTSLCRYMHALHRLAVFSNLCNKTDDDHELARAQNRLNDPVARYTKKS